MDKNVESVEAASLLSRLFQKLFKGLEKLLDETAKYEDENGVMKQVTQVIIRPSGSDEEYVLKIKLAPVKDKENWFYIEAETNAPNFDVSSINKETIELTKENKSRFEKMVLNLINKNNFEYVPPEDAENTEDVVDDGSGLSKDDIEEVKDTEEEIQVKLKNSTFSAVDKTGRTVSIRVQYKLEESNTVCKISTFVVNSEGEVDPEYVTKNEEFDTVYEDGSVISPSEFWATIKKVVDKYAELVGLKDVKIEASTRVVDATFIKASDTQDIELTAVNASCSIRAALDIIDEVADSDEFYNMITEDPISLRITEEADDYLIDEINEVNTDSTYIEFFEEISKLYAQIQSLKWKVGGPEFDNCTVAYNVMWNLDDLHERSAVWAIQHNPDYNPVPQTSVAAVGEVCEVATKIGDMLIEVLEDYYVNLSHDEQKVVDDKLQEIKNAMIYA